VNRSNTNPVRKMNSIKKILHSVLHPFQHPLVLPGHPLSPLDAKAEQLGIAMVDRFFENEGRSIANVFARFLGNEKEEAVRALKKDYHVIFEHRLRAIALRMDAAEKHQLEPVPLGELGHPLDDVAYEAVFEASKNLKDISPLLGTIPKSALRHWLSLLGWAVAFNASALWVLIRHGRLRVTPYRIKVATPDFGDSYLWQTIYDAWTERLVLNHGDLLMISEEHRLSQNIPFPIVSPLSFKVPIVAWLRRVVWPGIVSTLSMLILAVKGRRDPRIVEAAVRALNMAGSSITVWRIGFNVRASWYLDLMDYSSKHNLKGVIFRSFGMKIVRWPYAQIESPGTPISYLGYDLFLSGGPYQKEQYQKTWNSSMISVSVGQFRNDRHIAYGPRLNQSYAQLIRDRISIGEKMALFLTGNDTPGLQAAGETLFRIVIPIFANRPGWFLVIKPKKSERIYGVLSKMRDDPEIAPNLDAKNVIVLPCDVKNPEVCPTAWLLKRTTMGVTLPGSVHFEGLVLNVPLIAYFPINQQTPARQLLIELGLLQDSEKGFREKLEEILIDNGSYTFPVEKIRQAFDPFADHEALSRIGDVLFVRKNGVI
jgi:hypothetical protein